MNLGKLKLYRKIAGIKMYLQPNFQNSMKVGYFKSNNFGDALNPILLKELTNNNIVHVPTEFYHKIHLLGIGSILQISNNQSYVWGSGFISNNASFYYSPPKKIFAVRGPKTKDKLNRMGIFCPEVFGDPALLMPFIYKPKIIKKYKYGIIPHYSNKNDEWLKSVKTLDEITIIDVMDSNPLKVIDKINECEIILSSSLHGIIIGDAYNIPAYWLKFSIGVGIDDFKFYDYFESVNRFNEKPLKTTEYTFNEIIKKLHHYNFHFDPIPLLSNFPFNQTSIFSETLLKIQ